MVAAALASCLPWEITTTGSERVWAVTVNSQAGDLTIISAWKIGQKWSLDQNDLIKSRHLFENTWKTIENFSSATDSVPLLSPLPLSLKVIFLKFAWSILECSWYSVMTVWLTIFPEPILNKNWINDFDESLLSKNRCFRGMEFFDQYLFSDVQHLSKIKGFGL